MHKELGDDSEDTPVLPRRRLLKGMVFAMPALWLMGQNGFLTSSYAAVETERVAPSDFMSLSRLLTGHSDIADELADVAWAALCQRNEKFAERFAALSKAAARSGLERFEDYPDSSIALDPGLKATAVDIVSAWYLGRVGRVDGFSDASSTMVTYHDALMWRPTIDVTVIPTYARGGPGHWAEPPHGVTPRS
ncbi:sugar dehydrogenase complex small subunit [Halomonas sp. THAF12]